MKEGEPYGKRRKSGDGVKINDGGDGPETIKLNSTDHPSSSLPQNTSDRESFRIVATAESTGVLHPSDPDGGGVSQSLRGEVKETPNPKIPRPDSVDIPPVNSKTNEDRGSAGHKSLQGDTHGEGVDACSPPSSPITSNEASSMLHLREKYAGELEYMLREFRKLERQLLGANRASQIEESAGSRERREKLHSFILHLEDTARQIELGCKLEAEAKSSLEGEGGNARDGKAPAVRTSSSSLHFDDDAGDIGSQSGKDAENVQRLEEHILANLLPVKVRLKKQLAAQQGATRNPAGMPTPRRGMLQLSAAADRGKGTFAAAAEQRRKQAEEARLATQQQRETQFSNVLGGGGSSLTQKLHGVALGRELEGESEAPSASGSTSSLNDTYRKVLYAGITPGSEQHQSGAAAASVHNVMIERSQLLQAPPAEASRTDNACSDLPISAAASLQCISKAGPGSASVESGTESSVSVVMKSPSTPPVSALDSSDLPVARLSPSDEERQKLRQRRRKKKLQKIARRKERERQRQLMLHHQAAQAAQVTLSAAAGRKKSLHVKIQGKKGGPRSVEYICALCSEAYSSSCDCNPWWALAQHECPKCHKTQIPRIDITSPANAIEYHPALLAHAEDNGGGGAGSSAVVLDTGRTQAPFQQGSLNSTISTNCAENSASELDSESDGSEFSDGVLSDGSIDSDDSRALQPLSPAEQAERESFGHDYKGPSFCNEEASRLLILMSHAATCTCQHRKVAQRNVCKATKYLMLHVRDCPGTTSTFDVCPFPWCRKVKHLLYHLVTCITPRDCPICAPKGMSHAFKSLASLSDYRQRNRRRKANMVRAQTSRPVETLAPLQGDSCSNKSIGCSSGCKPVVGHGSLDFASSGRDDRELSNVWTPSGSLAKEELPGSSSAMTGTDPETYIVDGDGMSTTLLGDPTSRNPLCKSLVNVNSLSVGASKDEINSKSSSSVSKAPCEVPNDIASAAIAHTGITPPVATDSSCEGESFRRAVMESSLLVSAVGASETDPLAVLSSADSPRRSAEEVPGADLACPPSPRAGLEGQCAKAAANDETACRPFDADALSDNSTRSKLASSSGEGVMVVPGTGEDSTACAVHSGDAIPSNAVADMDDSQGLGGPSGEEDLSRGSQVRPSADVESDHHSLQVDSKTTEGNDVVKVGC